MALRIVNAAQQNYLEARHATEITAIAEQVAILQNHAPSMRADIDSAVDAIEKLRADGLARPTTTAAPTAASGADAAAPCQSPRRPERAAPPSRIRSSRSSR